MFDGFLGCQERSIKTQECHS